MTRMGMVSCNPAVCKVGGNCVQKSTIADMRQIVNDFFWGRFDDCAPSSKTRQLLILNILRSAYRVDSQEFHFYAGNKSYDNTRVCEAGFLILLGISNNPNASAAPRQWTHLKAYVKSGKEAAGIPYSSQKEDKLLKAEAKCSKFKSATTFIEFLQRNSGILFLVQKVYIFQLNLYDLLIYNFLACDNFIIAYIGGLNVYVAPFVDLKSFYAEYKYYHSHQQTRQEDIAGQTTFNNAFHLLRETKGIKLLKAKGAFQTCEICNNASELLNHNKTSVLFIIPLRSVDRTLRHSQREVI